jgi:aminoglycoside phosphotransferase (APT) family kinase protein
MPSTPTRTSLARALTAQGGHGIVHPGDLVELPRQGLMHRHWRSTGTGVVFRVPVAASAKLDVQAEGFLRLAASHHVPILFQVLQPDEGLPFGALAVEEIRGRQPRVPRDLTAIAEALAAIHSVPMPPPSQRAPLESSEEPFAATLAVVERNFAAGAASFGRRAREVFETELAWARDFAARFPPALAAGPRALVLTDAHPRNFIITRDGRAVAVDLEKVQYGAPGIDLAHAILPAAISWGRAGERLTEADRHRFFAAYFERRGRDAERGIVPFLPSMRRLTWLRTTAAFAAIKASGAEWALDPRARDLARRAIAATLDPRNIAAMRRALADKG